MPGEGDTSQTLSAGRPPLVITKDTTLKVSLVVLVSIVAYAMLGTWQFFELRTMEKDRVNGLVTNINMNAAQYTATTNQQLASIKSDLDYVAQTLNGYKARTDRLDESFQEIRLLRHRMDQNEQHAASTERRLLSFDTKTEEMYRKIAEHTIGLDYLFRWLHPSPGDPPPKKRNELIPFHYGKENRDVNNMLQRP